MKQLECGCETTDDHTRVLSACVLHAGYMRTHIEAAKHPRATGIDPGLRDKLLTASMPTCVEMLARGTDAETIAQGVTDLIHQIQRRCE